VNGLGVFVALMLLDLIVLWTLIRTNGWWSVRTAAIIVILAFNFITLNAFDSGNGWPIKGLPSEALLIDCIPVEPSGNDPGHIFLVGIPLKSTHHVIGYDSPSRAPRTYQLPYTRQMEVACQQAKKAQGSPMLFGKKGEHSRATLHGLKNQHKFTNPFYHLPPKYEPRKGTRS
jgi:hypothetical protein